MCCSTLWKLMTHCPRSHTITTEIQLLSAAGSGFSHSWLHFAAISASSSRHPSEGSPCQGVSALCGPSMCVLMGKAFQINPWDPPTTRCSRLDAGRAGAKAVSQPRVAGLGESRVEPCVLQLPMLIPGGKLGIWMCFTALGITSKSLPASQSLRSLFFPACK